jgi:hypothetical protein
LRYRSFYRNRKPAITVYAFRCTDADCVLAPVRDTEEAAGRAWDWLNRKERR